MYTIHDCTKDKINGKSKNKLMPNLVINQYIMYIVQKCAMLANIKHVCQLYFNSMKAGHQIADITCIMMRDK